MSIALPLGGTKLAVPRGWLLTTVGTVCDTNGGEVQTGPFGSQLHAHDYCDDGTPVVMPQDLINGAVSVKHVARVSTVHIQRLNRHQLRIDDVLYSRRGDVTRFAIIGPRETGWLCGTGCMRIRLNAPDVCSRFLSQYLRHETVRDWLEFQAKGATMPNLNTTILRSLPLLIPPLSEQKRIAGILDQADGLRRKRQQALALTDQFLRSTFLDLFGDPVTNPKRWPIHKLGDHLTFLTTGSRGWAEHYSDSGARFIRSLDVQMNFIGDDDVAWVNAPPGTEADRTRVRSDDVLLTVTGSKIGRVAPVLSDIAEAYISQHVALMRLDGSLRPRFLSMFLSDLRGGQQQIRRMQYGQTKPGLNLEQLRAFRIPCPPLSVQDNFLAQWDQLRRCHRRLEMSSLQSEALFNSLVQRAFRGEL